MSDELEKVLAKKDELLGEVKALRAKAVEQDATIAALTERAETSEAKLRKVLLENPVDEVLKGLLAVPSPRIMEEVRQTFGFTLADDGSIRFTDKDGNPLMLEASKEAREATFSAADVRLALEEHGGFDDVLLARGIGGTGRNDPPKPMQREAKPVAPQFGLR